jgi:hypothetical protein
MTSPAPEYFRALEQAAQVVRREDLYLWPRTPGGPDQQREIAERVGVSDRDASIRSSRPASIIRCLRRLRDRGLVPADMSICDVACGDGLVLWQIKRAFPEARCTGVDCRAGQLAPHAVVQAEGVALVRGYIQHLFASDPAVPFDVALMLNTYRDWSAAELRESERQLPARAEAWFAQNARYAIVTATRAQVRQMRSNGYAVRRIGPGEDDSAMVCFTRGELPSTFIERVGADALLDSRYVDAARRAYRTGGLTAVCQAVGRRMSGSVLRQLFR